jgi:deoxyribonuclease-4
MKATGRIDLVHANDSKDPFDSRRDRHENLGNGRIPSDQLARMIVDAGAPVVVETPGGAAEQGADIEWVRAIL